METAAFVQLMWLASPALPVGSFSYSEGLEAAVEAGLVSTEAQAQTWLHDQLTLALGRAELPLLAHAMAAWQGDDQAAVTALNDWVRLTRESAEFRLQTEQMGRSLFDWLRQRHPDEARVQWLGALRPAPTWPVAFALAGVLAGADDEALLHAFGFGWCENLVQAAMKAVPLGQAAAQRILARLAAALPAAAADALARADGEPQAYSPMLAILSARHEVQYSRLFRS